MPEKLRIQAETSNADHKRYFNILERIAEGYFEVDISGHFTFSNAAFSKLTGYSEDELLGESYRTFLEADISKTLYMEFHDVFETGAEKVLSYKITQKGGVQIHVETSIGLLRDDQGGATGFYGVMRDRSEQHESEIKYRTVLENMEEGYYEIDLNGRFTYFNASTVRMHGYPPEELMGMSYKQYLSEETSQKMSQIFSHMYETRQPMSILEYEIIRKDGSIRLCEMSVHPVIDTSGDVIGFRGLTRDRTERKKAEIALQQSEMRMRTIFESAAIGIVYYNAQGAVIRVNQGFCDIVGYTSNELLLMKAFDVVHPDDRHGDRKEIDGLLKGEHKSFSVEKRLVRKDGAPVWCRASISAAYGDSEAPIYFVGVFEDITDRKKAQKALEQSEDRYRRLVENATEGIYITRNGYIKYLNPEAVKLMGAGFDDLVDQPFAELVHPEDRETIYERQQRKLEDEQRPGVFSFRLINRKNEVLWVELSTVGIVWEEAPASLNFLRDITAQKKMENQLFQAQKMKAIGTLAGGVAHDFNNLLMGIQGNASLTLLDMNQNHPHYQHLKNIEQYVRAGADLTLQLLGAAKGGKYHARPTNLNQIINSSANLFGRTKKEITIHKKLQENLWTVEADQGQIEQVLLNLYVNAWQAMPGGGTLYLESKNVDLDANTVKPYGLAAGKYVRISVTDTGVGIAPKDMKRIFDPFFTTKGIGRGTGLGLASAYGIITNHGGIISAYSEEGAGATFKIYLPASGKKIIAAEETTSDVVMGDETVLYVDDEEGILDIGRLIMEKLGYSVVCAPGGKAAVDIYHRRHQEIDVVILDMIMPDQSGSETFNAMKKINPGVKVLLSSGYSLNSQAKEIIDRGCRGFIQKPFNIKELSQKLRQILETDG